MIEPKIRILHAIRQGKVGGGETHVLQLTQYLNSDKFDLYVLSFTDGPMIDQLNACHIQNKVIPVHSPANLLFWIKLYRYLRQVQPHVIHVHGSRAAAFLLPIARILRIPVVYTIHGWSIHPDQGFIKFHFRRFFERWITSNATVNVNVSIADQQIGNKYFQNYHAEIVHYGIDVSRFSGSSMRRNIRSEFNVPDDAILFGFIARMTVQKQPLFLLRAFEKLISSHNVDNVYLLMVGNGELRTEVENFIESHPQFSRYVRLSDFRQDVAEILSAIDIYCLPSLWEGMPIGLLEALSSGKIVLVSDISQNTEVVSDGINGYVFRVNDLNSILNKMNFLITHFNELSHIGSEANRTIHRSFTIHQSISQIERIYERAIRTHEHFVYAS